MNKFNVTWQRQKKRGSFSAQEVTYLRLDDAIWYSEQIKSDPNHTQVEVIPVFND